MRLARGLGNVSTMLHEHAHVWRRTLVREGAQAWRQGLHPRDVATLESHYGSFSEGGSKNRRLAEGRFARGVERYLYDGFAPTEALREAFARFSTWMREIYGKLQDSPIEEELHPEVRAVFDRMFGGDGQRVSSGRVSAGRGPAVPPHLPVLAAPSGDRREEKRRRVRAAAERRAASLAGRSDSRSHP